MSFTRRLLEEARAGIRQLMSSTSDGQSIPHVSEEDLAAEIHDRRQLYTQTKANPFANPIAKLASEIPGAIAARKKRAKRREERLQRIEEKRKRAASVEAARARKRFEREAEQYAKRAKQRASQTRQTRSRATASPSSSSLQRHYKTLGLTPSATAAEVKSAYRKLMRRYHPDRHTENPKKQKAATEKALRVSQAYEALEKHLK